jgi:glycosyltransferase involved in cell wall biosynthesis
MSFEETGRYELDNLEALVEQKNIDVFLLPSIWPETYSFTADEIMQMGFPLIAFDLGAPAERIKGYPLGKVIARSDLYQTLFGLHSSDNDRRDAFALSGSSTP